MDGREVLAAIKDDPEFRRIPVVVLTTSEAEEDILRSYDLHANAYVTKPVHFERFMEVVRQVDEFFITIVKPPPLTATPAPFGGHDHDLASTNAASRHRPPRTHRFGHRRHGVVDRGGRRCQPAQ